jgi:hypothetical protein
VLFPEQVYTFAKPFHINRLMHEGYDADDIFMVVEDEFQTVAQSFTHHLHHAEYVRMKKKARTASPPISTIPLDGMRAETRNRLEAKNLSSRQSRAIKDMIGVTGLASPEEEEEEEEKANDPWQGTSLAGLMSKDGTQARTALIGLEQIPSSTRAARGFGRGEADSQPKRGEDRSILEIFGGKGSRSRATSPSPRPLIEAPSEEEDDDLDMRSRIKPVVTNGKPRSLEAERDLSRKTRIRPGQPSNKLTNSTSPPDSRPRILMKSKVSSTTSRTAPKYSISSTRRTIDDFDDICDDDLEDFSTVSRRVFSKTRAKGSTTKEKDKKSRLNEIPTFLV